jgi:hypothetical protein
MHNHTMSLYLISLEISIYPTSTPHPQLPNPLQLIHDLLTLLPQLRLIAQMLELAAAALFIDLTWRRDPVRTRLQHLNQIRSSVVLLQLRNPHSHALTRQRPMNKKGIAIHTAYPFTYMTNAEYFGFILLIQVHRERGTPCSWSSYSLPFFTQVLITYRSRTRRLFP